MGIVDKGHVGEAFGSFWSEKKVILKLTLCLLALSWGRNLQHYHDFPTYYLLNQYTTTLNRTNGVLTSAQCCIHLQEKVPNANVKTGCKNPMIYGILILNRIDGGGQDTVRQQVNEGTESEAGSEEKDNSSAWRVSTCHCKQKHMTSAQHLSRWEAGRIRHVPLWKKKSPYEIIYSLQKHFEMTSSTRQLNICRR